MVLDRFLNEFQRRNLHYHFSVFLSLLSIIFIFSTLRFSILDDVNPNRAHRLSRYGIYINYDNLLYFYPAKLFEIAPVFIGWCSSFCKSRIRLTSSCYSSALIISLQNFVIFSVFFSCYGAYCQAPEEGFCGNETVYLYARSYFNPAILTPSFVAFQFITIIVLFLCHNQCNLMLLAKEGTSLYPQHLLKCAFKIHSAHQLTGMIIEEFLGILYIQLVCLDYFIWKKKSTGLFTIGMTLLGLLGKLFQVILYFLGIKFGRTNLLLSALISCVLGIACALIAYTLFLFGKQLGGNSGSDFYINSQINMCYLAMAGISVFLTEILSFRALWMVHRRLQSVKQGALPNEGQEKLVRIPKVNLTLGNQIGSGKFGEVFKAKIQTLNHSVAAKRLNSSATPEMHYWFLEESILMTRLNHPNIIKVIGICMDTRPMLLCMEYMEGGSLLTFLWSNDARERLSQYHLLAICLDVAYAAEYMEREGFIHRDIAARNCLLQPVATSIETSTILVKLADFGLARDTRSTEENSYRNSNSPFPVHNTAPEGFHGIFSSKSDVWSIGILIFQVFAWGADLFGKCKDISGRHNCTKEKLSIREVENMIRSSKTLFDLSLPCSSSLPESLRSILQLCWHSEPESRPCCSELVLKIEAQLQFLSQNPCFPRGIFCGNEELRSVSSADGTPRAVGDFNGPNTVLTAADYAYVHLP